MMRPDQEPTVDFSGWLDIDELEDHRWVNAVHDVSILGDNPHFVVIFDTTHLPDFVLNHTEFELREVWVDRAPSRIQKLLARGSDRARRMGWGRDAIGCLIEVTQSE